MRRHVGCASLPTRDHLLEHGDDLAALTGRADVTAAPLRPDEERESERCARRLQELLVEDPGATLKVAGHGLHVMLIAIRKSHRRPPSLRLRTERPRSTPAARSATEAGSRGWHGWPRPRQWA